MAKFIESAGGRKFILTLLFVVIVFANKLLNVGLGWQELLVLAGMFGIYDVSNAVKAMANKTIVSTYTSQFPEVDTCEAPED